MQPFHGTSGVGVVATNDNAALLAMAAAMFRAYAAEVSAVCGVSLAHQSFEKELRSLPGAFAAPHGGLWLALQASAEGTSPLPIGCIAIRPLFKLEGRFDPAYRPSSCELKRMYVAPESRKKGVGALLLAEALSMASAVAYETIYLDTSSTMHDAMRLYRGFGFVPCARYNDDPMDDTLWFEKVLR